jgi:hypothetical protein
MWLNKVTLDIIGLTGNLLSVLIASIAHSESHVGFNYAFDSLHSSAEEKTTNDTYRAIRSVLSRAGSPDPLFIIQLFLPMFRLIVSFLLDQKGGETYILFYSQLVALVPLVALSKIFSALDPNLSRRGRLPCTLSAMLMGPVP